MKYKILLLLLPFVVFPACQSKKATPGKAGKTDFDAFYERFHADSLYQMAHINFPLPGMPDHADSLTNVADFRWQKEDWIMHRPIDLSEKSGFKREFSVVGEDLINETVYHTSGRFAMERRFAKIGNEWYLIYYAGMHAVK